MANVNIKQVHGGEVTTPANSTDGVLLDTGTVSNWISVANLATYVWNYLTSLTAKTTLVDADQIGIADSAASNVGKKITWANLMAQAASYTQTLTNKRRTLRTVTVTQSATPTINTDNGDLFIMTGLAQAITSLTTNLSGTPTEGQWMQLRITDNGTARAITPGASFLGTAEFSLSGLTTTANKPLDLLWQWEVAANVWKLKGKINGA